MIAHTKDAAGNLDTANNGPTVAIDNIPGQVTRYTTVRVNKKGNLCRDEITDETPPLISGTVITIKDGSDTLGSVTTDINGTPFLALSEGKNISPQWR